MSIHQLIHVSDLHFGDNISSPSWAGPSLGRFNGVAIHNYDVAMALSQSVAALRLAGGTQTVVATGDLTTWGRPQAFLTAMTYLRSQFNIGVRALGLNDSNAPVVPGNHDIWSGQLLGFTFATPVQPSTRPDFDQYFNPPAPNLHSGTYFPYCVRLCDGPPAIYLYGLDSTRVDKTPRPRYNVVFANGLIDQPPQLDELQQLLASERDEPRIRIAALHHPLAYRRTTGTPRTEVLLNLDQVLDTLQTLRFAAALSGHQHTGFARQSAAPNNPNPPVHILSVGTSTQMVRLKWPHEWWLLKEVERRGLNALTQDEHLAWLAVVEKFNEYRLYDFATQPNGALTTLQLHVRAFKYTPNMLDFAEHVPPQSLIYQLGSYVIT